MVKIETMSGSNNRPNMLCACVTAILGLTSTSVFATVFVTNCNDAGPGSLRNAVAGAPTGETVDATGVGGACSKITLSTGAITISQADLTIKGPGASNLSVSAKYTGSTNHQYQNRIFTHTGTGTLYLQDITVTKGYQVNSPAKGGCILSQGSVTLKDTDVTFCTAKNDAGASGGAIYAPGTLTMKESTLTFNTANGGNGSIGVAGGAKVGGFRAYYSSVFLNSSTNTAGTGGLVGGIYSTGPTYLFNSTIGANQAAGNVGGLASRNSQPVKVVNSTISSNASQKGVVGGLYLYASTVQISNSTITANTAFSTSASQPPGAQIIAASVVMQSSIIANNLYGSPATVESDLSSTVVITGNNNLVQSSNASLPGDTIVGKCAFLGPLQNNGGLTETNALLGHSPAIDAGNNALGAGFDQRGKTSVNGDKNYPRVVGPPGGSPRADIGAYELDRADKIYDADFDSC